MPDDQQKQTTEEAAQVEFVYPDPESGLFTTYSNHLQLGYTLYDLRMVFGEIVDVESGKVIVEQRAHVTVAWLQAKLLFGMLGQALAAYEARNGEIKVPEGITTALQAMASITTPGSVSES